MEERVAGGSVGWRVTLGDGVVGVVDRLEEGVGEDLGVVGAEEEAEFVVALGVGRPLV